MSIEGSDKSTRDEIRSLRDLSPYQWKSGIAAWLGWLFDGLDMHLYVLVAAPFVAELIGVSDTRNEDVGRYSSWIQAAFLVGWALGGGFFGRVGDLIGRSRTLCLTILTYALFTGLAFFVQTWWQLLIVRFLAALGIGGEWAVGASLLSETWPRRWRPWIAAVLQSGVNIGVLLASCATFLLAGRSPRVVFLVGVVPALLVFWIRREVPETEEWRMAKRRATGTSPGIADLFRGEVRRTAVLTILVCSVSLTAHWAFLFWYQQHLRNLPDVINMPPARKNELASVANVLVMVAAILGNFFAAGLAHMMGYRRSIALLCLAYSLAMVATYVVPQPHDIADAPSRDGRMRRDIRALHDVSAAVVPGPPEDHRGRLLLQHRPHRGGGRDRRLRVVLEGGRLPDRPPLRRVPFPAGDVPCLVAARFTRSGLGSGGRFS